MACKSTADVMIKIAEKLKGDADLTSLAVRNFDRGLWVCVGSYGGEEFNPENAPFVWIAPSDDTSPVTFCEETDATITSFAVNIVIGMCPMKDAPTIDNYIDQANAVADAIHYISTEHGSRLVGIAETYGTSEQAAIISNRMQSVQNTMTSAYVDVKNLINDLNAAADAANIESFNTAITTIGVKVANYSSAVDEFKIITDDVADIASQGGGTSEASECREIGAIYVNYKTTANEKLTNLQTRVDEINSSYAEYVEDPYFREEKSSRTASASGVTVFGAVRLIDAFRRAAVKALTANDFGIPLASMKFANKSTSHYPLDWLEISANFAEPSSF